jgi:hypothetical protein
MQRASGYHVANRMSRKTPEVPRLAVAGFLTHLLPYRLAQSRQSV